MSTSEAQVIARALYDALVGGALQALRTASVSLNGANPERVEERLDAILAPHTPREVRNLIVALAREQRIGNIGAITQAFEQLAQAGSARRISAEITSAVALDASQQEKITADLRARYGEGIETTFDVDESLIGGLVIRVGDQVLDNSLRTRLSAIQRNMMSS